jgi:hypothetical protein
MRSKRRNRKGRRAGLRLEQEINRQQAQEAVQRLFDKLWAEAQSRKGEA